MEHLDPLAGSPRSPPSYRMAIGAGQAALSGFAARGRRWSAAAAVGRRGPDGGGMILGQVRSSDAVHQVGPRCRTERPDAVLDPRGHARPRRWPRWCAASGERGRLDPLPPGWSRSSSPAGAPWRVPVGPRRRLESRIASDRRAWPEGSSRCPAGLRSLVLRVLCSFTPDAGGRPYGRPQGDMRQPGEARPQSAFWWLFGADSGSSASTAGRRWATRSSTLACSTAEAFST